MMIFDAHLDMAWNACEWNRNLLLPVAEIRQFEKHFENAFPGANTVSWPELRRGGVGTIVATLLPRLHRRDKALTFYQSREAAFAASCGQLAYYRAMAARGHLRELPDRETLQDHVAEWRKNPETCSDRLHSQHGGELVDPVAGPNRGVVRRRASRTRAGPLRPRLLLSRHGKRRRTQGGRTRAACVNGTRRHDPRRDASGRQIVLAGAGDLRRTGSGQPSQLPIARPRRPATYRRANQGPDCPRCGDRRLLRQLDAQAGLEDRRRPHRKASRSKTWSTIPTTSARLAGNARIAGWGPISMAVSAKSSRRTTSTRSPNCPRLPTSFPAAAILRTTSKAFCGATSSTSSIKLFPAGRRPRNRSRRCDPLNPHSLRNRYS